MLQRRGLLRPRDVGVVEASGVLEAVKMSGQGDLGSGFWVRRMEANRWNEEIPEGSGAVVDGSHGFWKV